jgi:hypothetical protein
MRGKRFQMTAVLDPSFEPYMGRKGHRRVLQMSPSDAKTLGVKVDDLVEILGKNPAPLRAWVVIKGDAKTGTFPIDEFGCRVLGIKNGHRVEIRYLWTPHIPKGMAS